MEISKDFAGGNIEVLKLAGNTVTLERELRDSVADWFYWAFCVTGAAGQTVTFRFPCRNRIGRWGASVSHDLDTWEWTGQCEIGEDYESFTYTFGTDENKVYFAHDMLYLPARFEAFAAKNGWELETLCTSRKGRSVPYIRFGEGDRKILLTSRHHACESTGTYVLEGVLSALSEVPPDGYEIVCVPFVDYDGVIDGDQGKRRAPHDHNRDYPADAESIYPSCAAIRALADASRVELAFDLHSPWHIGGKHDKVFLVYGLEEYTGVLKQFGSVLEACITADSLCYRTADDQPANVEWNKSDAPTCSRYLLKKPECRLAVSLETTYFGERGNEVSQDKMLALGRCLAKAIRNFVAE